MPQTQPTLSTAELERLALFISSITDYAIYMLSAKGTVASWNAGAQRFKGYAAEDIIGRHFSCFYTEEDRAAGVPAYALHQAATAGKFEAEGWRVRKDGTRFWASVVIDPVRDGSGELVGYAKITRDITERKKAQEALRESEQRFRMLVEGVTDYAIYMLSPEGTITNWNAGARRIKGFEGHEVVGSHFGRFYTEEDRAHGLPQAALGRAASEGRHEAEGWRVRRDGSRFFAHVVIDPIKNDLGELVGFAKITRDITERRAAQAELERAREALFQAQKMEAIGKVTGGVAHDFNNLLGVVTNGLALLRTSPQQPRDLKLIDTMDQAIRRGAGLVQQLMAFARKQPMVRRPCDLNRVVGGFEAVLRGAGRSATPLELQLAPAVPEVLADAAQVETGLLNLVVNAYDATPDHGRVTVLTHVVELQEGQVKALPAGRYVALAVSDTGHGMPPETVERVVEPFFTTKEVGKGTGLGLSQVYGMVQQSDGALTIESAEGRGTTITLYFPATGGSGDRPRNADADTVLVVDDQADVLDMTAELFRSLGFEVVPASSGEHALDVLRRNASVGLLFSDVTMSGMGGVELAQAAVALRPQLKVILASGYTGADVQLSPSGHLAGFPFLAKPYRINDVLRTLRQLG